MIEVRIYFYAIKIRKYAKLFVVLSFGNLNYSVRCSILVRNYRFVPDRRGKAV